MEFICNANFKGDYGKPIKLRKLHKRIPNSTLHIKPHQLVVKDLKGTVIFFSNGKFRVMGCIDKLEASLLLMKYLQMLKRHHELKTFPSITLQSYTQKYNLGYSLHLPNLVP